jgi:hypothetical protein
MRTVIYATDPQRFGRTEWRLEVWESSDDSPRIIVPVFRGLSETRWRLPAEHAGDWPKSLFKLAVENVIKLADALRG